MACEIALGVAGIGRRFRENLDAAVEANGLPVLDWGSGLWQRVLEIHGARNGFTHAVPSESVLFPPIDLADRAIEVLRKAVVDVFGLARQSVPPWIADDEDRGWATSDGSMGHAQLLRGGVTNDTPGAIRIAYVYKGREYVSDVLPPESDPVPAIDELLSNIGIPISAVRAYRGVDLVVDRPLRMRGN